MNSKCMYILEIVHFTNSIKFDKTNAHKYEWNPCKCIEEFILLDINLINLNLERIISVMSKGH